MIFWLLVTEIGETNEPGVARLSTPTFDNVVSFACLGSWCDVDSGISGSSVEWLWQALSNMPAIDTDSRLIVVFLNIMFFPQESVLNEIFVLLTMGIFIVTQN